MSVDVHAAVLQNLALNLRSGVVSPDDDYSTAFA